MSEVHATSLDHKLSNRLTRFLHTGTELPKYYPGCWSSHKYFEADKLPVVNEILEKTPDSNEIVNIIVKAYKDGWYTRYETIAFALTKILSVSEKDSIKEAVYNAVSEVCENTEQLMLFNKFTRIMKTGQGSGWRDCIKNWYLLKDPMYLAKEMTRAHSRYGQSHKTLIRKCHLQIANDDHAREALVKYAIFGLKAARELKGDSESAKPILNYIQRVEEIRHSKHPEVAAIIVSQYNFSLDHVPGHLLTSQEVWNAVIPRFSLRELLFNIQRIHNMGFFTNYSLTTRIVASMLSDKDYIKNSNVSTLEVYITLVNYIEKGRPMKYEKKIVAEEKEKRRRARQVFDAKTGQWEWRANKRHPRELKTWGIDMLPNPSIQSHLTKLMEQTWDLSAPTGARYMITMDMRKHMFCGRKNFQTAKRRKTEDAVPASGPSGDNVDIDVNSNKRLPAACFYNSNITPGHAAILLALQIMKREKEVNIALFTEGGVKVASLDRTTNIKEAEFILREKNLGRVSMNAPIKWAAQNKLEVDVFINITDIPPAFYKEPKPAESGGRGSRYDCPVHALKSYRSNLNLPKTKLVVMSLATHHVATTDGSHEGVLDVVGVDEHVLKVIDAFVLGHFQ